MAVESDNIAHSLHPLERKVLPVLENHSVLSDIVRSSGLSQTEVLRGLGWLESKGLAKVSSSAAEIVDLDTNGRTYAERGLPERRLAGAVPAKGVALPELRESCGLSAEEFNVSFGQLKGKGIIAVESGRVPHVVWGPRASEFPSQTAEERFLKRKFPARVDSLAVDERHTLSVLRSRKGIVRVYEEKSVSASLTHKGKNLLSSGALGIEVLEHLTPQMLVSGDWRGKSFRRFDVTAPVPRVFGGRRHIVSETIDYVKRIWLDMGFKEMSGNLVQTSFWNLDVLFTPQDHPARDMADTFFLPVEGKLPSGIAKKVGLSHTSGVSGSKGYGGFWSEAVAKKVLLRTHTTVLSAQTLAALKDAGIPAKFFAVGRVFRNETLDWKHLFEFHQVEGIVVDPDANLRHLLGYLKQFYRKMGFPDVRVRPSFFPYTEPSLEVDVWHPVREEWVEVGGAGIFRPEVVVPLLGKDVPVLAWGQGLERVLTEYYKMTDLRQIYRNDVNDLRSLRAMVR